MSGFQYGDKNLQRCMDLSSDLIRAAYDKSKPIDRDLAIGVAECVAYLLSRVPGQRGARQRNRCGENEMTHEFASAWGFCWTVALGVFSFVGIMTKIPMPSVGWCLILGALSGAWIVGPIVIYSLTHSDR